MYKPQFRTKQNGVPVLSKKEIEVIGENFLRDFCPDALINPQPVDIERFLELYLGLKIDYQFLSNDGRYLGMMVFNDTDKVIIYNPEKNEADYVRYKANRIDSANPAGTPEFWKLSVLRLRGKTSGKPLQL